MFYITLTIVTIVLLFLFYLNVKIKLKSSLMRDNQLLQSETTSSLLSKMERQDSAEQEERLMKNARYRALKAALNLQVAHYKSLSLADVEESFKNSKTIRQVLQHESYNFVLKVKYLPSATTPALHIVVKPNTLLGALFSVEEWIHYT